MKTLVQLLVLWSLLFNPCLSGTIAPGISDHKYVEYGSNFQHVVQLTAIDKDNKKMLGSAVIINDHWVLTAAHIIKDCKSCVITLKDKKYCLSFVVYHKDFVEDDVGKNDIAAGYSKDKFDIDFKLDLYTENDEVGKTCSIVGFGVTGTFNTGVSTSDNKKRGGSNRIKETFRDLLMCSVSDPKPTSLEFLIASGDSGGGLFINGKLAGINSCVMSDDKNGPNSDYGDESGHTRISNHLEWIEEITQKTEVTSNLEPSE